MNKIIKSFASCVAVATASLMIANSALAAKTLKIQLAVPTSSDEAKIVQDFADDVENLTKGEVKLELLPAGAVVGVSDIIDAVDSLNRVEPDGDLVRTAEALGIMLGRAGA